MQILTVQISKNQQEFSRRYQAAIERAESRGLLRKEICARIDIPVTKINAPLKTAGSIGHTSLLALTGLAEMERDDADELRFSWYRTRCVAATSQHRRALDSVWSWIDGNVSREDRRSIYNRSIDLYIEDQRGKK